MDLLCCELCQWRYLSSFWEFKQCKDTEEGYVCWSMFSGKDISLLTILMCLDLCMSVKRWPGLISLKKCHSLVLALFSFFFLFLFWDWEVFLFKVIGFILDNVCLNKWWSLLLFDSSWFPVWKEFLAWVHFQRERHWQELMGTVWKPITHASGNSTLGHWSVFFLTMLTALSVLPHCIAETQWCCFKKE